MNLKEKIEKNLREAQLKKDSERVAVLRLLLAAIHNKEIEKRTRLSQSQPLEKLADLSRLSEEEIQEVLASLAKKQREAITLFQQGKRPDLVEKETRELQILQTFLPPALSEQEIRELARRAIEKTGTKSLAGLGRVLAELSPWVKGRAEGGQVAQITRELLSERQ